MQGGVAQMVERSLSMREVPGSIPGISSLLFLQVTFKHECDECSIWTIFGSMIWDRQMLFLILVWADHKILKFYILKVL